MKKLSVKFPRLTCKPHSVHAGRPTPMTISLGCELPHTSCGLPEVVNLAIQVAGSYHPMGLPLLDLAPDGGYLAVDIAAHAGGLLHHLFTLTCHHPVALRSVSVARSGRLPRPGSYPAPCPMECGLSSIVFLPRSSGRPGYLHHTIVFHQPSHRVIHMLWNRCIQV
jgi:hypothetical protein